MCVTACTDSLRSHMLTLCNYLLIVLIHGPQSAKTDLRMTIFKIGFLAQSSSLGLVDDAQSKNIDEKREYMP